NGSNFSIRDLEISASGFGSEVQMPMLTSFIDEDIDGSEAGISGLSASDMGFINVPAMTSTDGVGISFDQLSSVSVSQLTTMQNGVLDLIGFEGGFIVNMSNTTDMTGSVIVLSGEAEVDLSSLTQFDGGGMEVYGASFLRMQDLTSYLLESNIFGDTALWRAEGAGSTIIMNSLLTGQVGLDGTGGTKRWDIEAVNSAGGGIFFNSITDLLVEDSGNFSLRTINILADGAPALVDLQPMNNFIDNDSQSPSTVTTAGGGGVVNISALANLQNVTINGSFALGDTGPGGGLVFYVDGSGGGLEAAPADLEDPNNPGVSDFLMPWGCSGTVTGATDETIGAGAANTDLVVNNGCSTAGNEAAEAAAAYSNNGFNDWFLPSKDELNEMYLEIGQGGDGFNEGGFAFGTYWSSSEINSNDAWRQFFGNGFQDVVSKFNDWRVRAVRAF
ncbi:MAG: DUF1566 domain-containing protein, partial [Gammaproteobacteria bacterium]|nr:DUF1566 domain-containing protein [Gammaproteobacteria bacterium]